MPPALANPADKFMTIRGLIAGLTQQEDLNFLLTNRIPRAALTRFMGWFSKIENPLVRDRLDRLLAAVFRSRSVARPRRPSSRACTIALRANCARACGRPIPIPRSWPARRDAIIGAHRRDRGYRTVPDQGRALFAARPARRSRAWSSAHRNGRFITLRLTSSMYHRFHAPYDCRIEQVTFIHGDTWNVNPIALKRVERLFCKNERAVLQTRLATGEALTLVPVAAILVASIRLHFLDVMLNAQTQGADRISLRRQRPQGRRTRLVRAWLDHHRAGAGSFRVLRRHRRRSAHPRRPAVDAEIFGVTGALGARIRGTRDAS